MTLSYRAVWTPLLLLLQLQEVVVDLVEHEVRHLGGVEALGAHIGWRTVAPGLAVGLDADSLEIFIYQGN